MATSAAQLKVWKVKKQKLNGKLKALREEEEEFKAMLEVYTQQSTESVNAIISNKNYKEFNEKYEETSSNMDKFINELFSLRMILSENLEGLFGEELDNTSAEEEEDYNTAASYTSTPEIMKSDHPAKLKQIAKNNCCKSLDMQETKIISTDKSDELMTLDTTLSERHPKTPTSITEDFRLESSSPEGNISPNTFKNNIFQLRDSPEFIEKTLIQSSENQTTDSKEISVWSAVDEKKAFSLKSNSSIQSSNFSTEYTTPEAKPIIDNPLSNSTLANFKSQDAKENLQIKENKIWESRELIIGPLEAPKSTCPPVNNSSIQSSNASNVKKVQSASPVAKSIFNNDDSNSTLLNPEAPTFQSTATDKCNLDSSNFLQSPQQPPKGSENLTNHIQISDNLELESFNKPNLHSQNEETLHCASQLVGNESPTNESNNNGMIKTVATVNDTICCSNSNQFSMVPNKQNINKKWKVTITHVNNLVDFYVLCQPELTEKFIEELRTNFVPTEPVILLEKGNWYIASVPYSDPFRACLLDCDENKATVQNIDVGTIYKVNVLYLFDFPTPYYLEIPPAVHCSLYQYSSLVGWDTSDAVEGLQRICQLCPVYAKFYDSQSDDSIMFVELFFSVSGALINFQDYYSELHHAQCSVLHEQSTLTITELPPETTIQVETTARDSSSDRSTPENQLEWRASILPPYCPDVKDGSLDLIPCIACLIRSPAEFYVNLVLPECAIIDSIQEEMLEFYSELQLKDPVYKKVAVQPKSYWCCKNSDPEDKFWYRVQVLSFIDDVSNLSDSSVRSNLGPKKIKCRSMNPLAKIKVICVDYGSVFEIELKDLYPLAKRFTQIPALAIRCSLANLEPADNKLNWSPDSIKKFHELVTYESIEELQIVKITEPGNFIVNLLNEDRISVSDILVEAGVANVMKPDPDLECFDGFDPLKEDFTSERNNYNLDVDDAGVAVTGYKSHNESYICKFYANNGECPRKRSCPYLHLQYSGDYTQDVEYFYTIVEQQIPSLNVRLVAQVSAMFSPGHFYIICPFGLEDVAKVTKSDLNSDDFYTQQDVLEFLHEDMNKFYKSHSSVFDNVTSDLSIGAVVACKYTDDCWYRAKVSAYTENEDVSVIYLDFGNQAIVSRCNIRELQPQFIHLPQQSYECYLNSVSPTKAGQNGWSEDSFEYFKSQIKNEFLIAKVVRTVNTVLYVDLYKSNVENGQPIRLNTMLVANGYAEAVLPCFTDIDYVDEDDDNCSSSQLGAYGPG